MSFVKEITLGKRTKLDAESKKKSKETIDKLAKENAKLVKGIFRNMEVPGGDLEFAYREFPGEPVRVYHFWDGQEYEIPLGVAKHINKNTKVGIRDYMRNAKGEKLLTSCIGGWRQRYTFTSSEFM